MILRYIYDVRDKIMVCARVNYLLGAVVSSTALCSPAAAADAAATTAAVVIVILNNEFIQIFSGQLYQ